MAAADMMRHIQCCLLLTCVAQSIVCVWPHTNELARTNRPGSQRLLNDRAHASSGLPQTSSRAFVSGFNRATCHRLTNSRTYAGACITQCERQSRHGIAAGNVWLLYEQNTGETRMYSMLDQRTAWSKWSHARVQMNADSLTGISNPVEFGLKSRPAYM